MKSIKIYLIFTITALFFSELIAAQIHIKGIVDINLKTGLFNCDFDLSNIPELKSYKVLLNKGMNIKYFKDDKNELINYDGHYNGKTKGEAIAYIIQDEKTKFSKFKITYTGAFPIYKNEYSSFDYKGLIANNGQTLRATEQTKWYPVIYDVDNDRLLNSYTYDITVKISGGNSIFINGSSPVKKTQEHFVSKKAHPLLLFVGDFNFIENNRDYIINTNTTKETAKKAFENITIIKEYYNKKLDIKFEDHIYLINHKAVNKRKKGSSWGFNTYPTFAFTNLNFDSVLDTNGRFSNNMLRYFAHEFAHNYFGNNVISGKLKWFWLESFPEYLSYILAEDLIGEQFLKETLKKRVSFIEKGDFISLDKVQKESDISENYRYNLAPMLLKCFELKFGRDKMIFVIKSLLNVSKNETLTLPHFKKFAIESGINKKEYLSFEKDFIKNKNFKNKIIKTIRKL